MEQTHDVLLFSVLISLNVDLTVIRVVSMSTYTEANLMIKCQSVTRKNATP